MAADISIDEKQRSEPLERSTPDPVDFEAFYRDHAPELKVACHLIAPDQHAADRAFERSAATIARQWTRLVDHPNPAGRWLDAAIDEIGRSADDTSDSTAGGYLRGLSLDQAVEALPARQRASLVTTYVLGWSDGHTARGLEVDELAVTTLRRRALGFVTHHLPAADDPVELVADYLTTRAALVPDDVPDGAAIMRRGRARKLLARGAVAIVTLAAIAVAGLIGSVERSSYNLDVHTPEQVEPPASGAEWFGPVSDGEGGFIALNAAGASRFSSSDDGEVWFEEATWNSRSINLRTEISGFERSGNRFVATIEDPSILNATVAPFIATSPDLRRWDVHQIDVEQATRSEGLRTHADILGTAATADRVLIGVDTRIVVDHASLSVRPSEVCRETVTEASVQLFLCDGSSIIIDTEGRGASADDGRARLYAQEDRTSLIELALPDDADPSTLVSFDEGFAMVEKSSGAIVVSETGRTWQQAHLPDEANRFMLLAGAGNGSALVVQPQADGWLAYRVDANGTSSASPLPITIDPALVWIKPHLVNGPAGWALFITTSRPWERAEATRGWAVEVDDWVVSRQPDSRFVTARSTDGSVSHRYRVALDRDPVKDATSDNTASGEAYVERPEDEAVTLLDPITGEVLVEVSQQRIDDSRPVLDAPSAVDAQVLFSEDGRSWRSIWESSTPTWQGSIAVGDNEVVLSGSQLTGPPIVIPLGE